MKLLEDFHFTSIKKFFHNQKLMQKHSLAIINLSAHIVFWIPLKSHNRNDAVMHKVGQ